MLYVLFFIIFSLPVVQAQNESLLEAQIDLLVQPYLATNNFSGSILVLKNDHAPFEKSYGKMNRAANLSNTADTKFFFGLCIYDFHFGCDTETRSGWQIVYQ